MADEITIVSGISALKTNLSITVPVSSYTADLSGSRFIRNCQNIGTTYEAITVGDVSSAGYCYIINLDSTNYVEIGREVAAAFYGVVRIDAGEKAGPFKLSTTSIFGRANTAAVNIDILIFEA